MPVRQRFALDGHLAIDRGALSGAFDQRAFGFFFAPPPPPETIVRDGVAIVAVRGALKHHRDALLDSYDAIKERVAEAIAARPAAVLLLIDSPGGDCSGCMDTASELRALAAKARVPLGAFIEGMGCSAAYALACAADLIGVSATASVGSVGVIEAMTDVSAQNAQFGVRVELIASGARKTDTNPSAPITDGAIAAARVRVDDLATQFFSLVSAARGVSPDDLRALEAGVFVGAKAVQLGLADQVTTLSQMVAVLSSSGGSTATTPRTRAGTAGEDPMDEEEKKARAALQAIVDDEKADDKAKARAKAALAAFHKDDDEGDDARAEGGDDAPAKDDARAAARAGAPAQARVSADTAADLATQMADAAKRLAKLESERETERRAQLLATRPDLPPELVKVLETKPLADVAAIVGAMKKPETPRPAAGAVVTATRGATHGETPAALPPDRELDVKMGLARATEAIRHDGTSLKLGVLTREEATELQRKRAEERAAAEKAKAIATR